MNIESLNEADEKRKAEVNEDDHVIVEVYSEELWNVLCPDIVFTEGVNDVNKLSTNQFNIRRHLEQILNNLHNEDASGMDQDKGTEDVSLEESTLVPTGLRK